MDDLTQRLRAEKSVIGNTRTFPSGDERDMVLVPIYGQNPLAHEAAARIEALEAKLKKAVDCLRYYAVEAMPWDQDDSLQARTTLDEIGETK